MINDKLGENAYNSSWKANLSNNKGIRIQQEKIGNSHVHRQLIKQKIQTHLNI